MKIGIISSRYPAGLKHDASRAAQEFAKGLAALGHTVTVYTYNSTRKTRKYWDAKNLLVVSVGILATLPIKAGLIYEDTDNWNDKIWNELAHEDNTKVLLVFDWTGFAAAVRHRTSYGTYIIGVVGVLINGRGVATFTAADKLAALKARELEFLKNADSLIAFNTCSQQEVAKLTDTSCTIVPLGIEPVIAEQTTVLGRVLIAGRIVRETCIEVVLRSMPHNSWMDLVVCGTGKNTDYAAYLIRLSVKLEISDRVCFQDGQPDYQSAEIVICPSIYDPFSYQLYDAFNYEVPVVAHSMSYEDVIKNGINGYCYQSLAELTEALNTLHGSKPLRKQVVAMAKKDCFTKDAALQRLLGVLSSAQNANA